MFSESVYSPSRKPVSSRRNDLIAVCWSQTNQSIDMCTLSLRCEDGQSLHKFLHFHHSQTSQYTITEILLASDACVWVLHYNSALSV